MDDREYEVFVGRLLEHLSRNDLLVPPGVMHRGKFRGKTGEVYEIDLSFTFEVAGARYLTLVECKHWNQRVGRDVVNAFYSVVNDVGAHKGIVVTTRGFQSGAIGAAEKNGIGLFKVSDRGQLEVVSHLTGHDARAIEFLERDDGFYRGGEIERAEGVVMMRTHVIDYVACRFGEEVAALLAHDKAVSIHQLTDGPFKERVIDQFLAMGQHWFLDYMVIEACGLNLWVSPYPYLRLISAKAAVNLLEAKELRLRRPRDT